MSCWVKTSTRTQSWISPEILVKTIPILNTDPPLSALQPGAVVPQQCSLLTKPQIQLEKTFKIVVNPMLTQHCQGYFSPHCQVTTPLQQWHPMAFSLWGSCPHFHSSVTFSWGFLLGRLCLKLQTFVCSKYKYRVTAEEGNINVYLGEIQ